MYLIPKVVSHSLSSSARSDETKFKPTNGRQPNWQLSIATSQWWQQCQKGGSAERTTAKRRPLHASGGAAASPLPAGPQSVTKTRAAPSTLLHAPRGWGRASSLHSTWSKPKQRTSDRNAAAEWEWDCTRWGVGVGDLRSWQLQRGIRDSSSFVLPGIKFTKSYRLLRLLKRWERIPVGIVYQHFSSETGF